jgi:hypothetical protein
MAGRLSSAQPKHFLQIIATNVRPICNSAPFAEVAAFWNPCDSVLHNSQLPSRRPGFCYAARLDAPRVQLTPTFRAR